MKRNIGIFLAVIGVFIGRSVSRRGDAELQLIVISLALLCVLFFGLYVYKKYHNYLLPLGCLLLILWFPAFEVVHNTVKTPNAEFWAVFSTLLFVFFGAFGCMFTGAHQIAPQNISHKEWKYWMLTLAGFWIVCCGGLAALTFL